MGKSAKGIRILLLIAAAATTASPRFCQLQYPSPLAVAHTVRWTSVAFNTAARARGACAPISVGLDTLAGRVRTTGRVYSLLSRKAGDLNPVAATSLDDGSLTLILALTGVVGVAVLFFLAAGALGAGLGGRPGYLEGGEVLTRLDLDGGGGLRVTAHRAPDEAGDKGRREWRVLRFKPSLQYCQAVTMVSVSGAGSSEEKVQLLGEVLSLPYNKSLVSVVLATLAAIGAPVIAAAEPDKSRQSDDGGEEKLRILCIGLGGGSVPSFFARMLPRCRVDVVELESAVLQAASDAMGFVEGPRLRVVVEDGAAFALNAANAAKAAGQQGVYDAVVVDAYDSIGNVPEVMWSPEGGVAQALSRGLLKARGAVAVNFLPRTDLGPRLGTYRDALLASGAGSGLGFSVTAEEGNLMTVQTCGGPPSSATKNWRAMLVQSAQDVERAINCPFNMDNLATSGIQIWQDS